MANLSSLLPIALIVLVFYFLLIRPQRRRAAETQRMMSALQPGTRVLLGSGIFGELIEIGDRQAVVEIAPGVEITVLRQAIARVATETDEEPVAADDFDPEDPADLTPEPIGPTTSPAPVTEPVLPPSDPAQPDNDVKR